MSKERFQRWFYPLQTFLGILLVISQVVGIGDVTDERRLTFRVLMTVVGVGLTLIGGLGWLISSRERHRPG